MPKLKQSMTAATAEMVQRNIESRACMLFGATTGKAIAEKIGMREETFRGKRRKPRTWTIEQLCLTAQALKVPLTWLFTDHTEEIKEDGT